MPTSNDIVISVEDLSKRYRLGQIGATTLRESAERLWEKVRGRGEEARGEGEEARGKGQEERGKTETLSASRLPPCEPSDDGYIWALKDVSFRVQRGEVLGIIGRNGAGKSTLLKILSRITEPTSGRAVMRGRVGSLLEVGTGFHPELTGRENVFLNGAILGMKRSEIAAKYDEIVAFSGVEKFIDTPVKRYSSGMQVRLAFAVAAHLDPEILLIDEVLAVGDAGFQKKCLGKMADVATEGRTILFVSHNMGAVLGLCHRSLWIDGGTVAFDGDPNTAVGRYLAGANKRDLQIATGDHDTRDMTIAKVLIKNTAGEATFAYAPGSDIVVEVYYQTGKRIARPYFWIGVGSQFGSLFGANMLFDGLRPSYVEGSGMLACVFRNVKLLPQTYSVSVGVRNEGGMQDLTPPVHSAAMFSVVGNARDYEMPGEIADVLLAHSAPMLVPYEWRFEGGQVAVPDWQKTE